MEFSGRGRGGGGGGRKGSPGFRGGGRGSPCPRKREIQHLEDFGEQHPSQDMGGFGTGTGEGSSNSKNPNKRFKGSAKGSLSSSTSGWTNKKEEVTSSSSEDEEVQDPYNQLLTLYKIRWNLQVETVTSDVDEEEEAETDEEEEKESESSDGDGGDENEDEKPEEADESPVLDAKPNKQNLIVVGEPQVNPNKGKHSDAEEDLDDETVIEDAELNPAMDGDEQEEDHSDQFLSHFEKAMPEFLLSQLNEGKSKRVTTSRSWSVLNKFNHIGLDAPHINDEIRKECDLKKTKVQLFVAESCPKPIILPLPPTNKLAVTLSLDAHDIKPQLLSTFPWTNGKVVYQAGEAGDYMTVLQKELFPLMSNYYDGYFPVRRPSNDDEIRTVYCLHVANHVLKTRTRILHHNAKMADRVDVPDSYRDQGFVRPRVLILVPFKNTATRIVKTLISLFFEDEKGKISNKKRFLEEYDTSTMHLPITNPKPDDYNFMFEGNVEDNFKIGISLTKKSLKLYTGFYASDIIIASPLGLRMVLGAEGEKGRDYDFLSSVELLIMDQADVFLMQNWDHLLQIMKHLHLKPVTTHGTDFSRVRSWALDGHSKFFRQTLIFSSIMCPEHLSLLSKYCFNFAGEIRLMPQYPRGSIRDVTVQHTQVFQYFDASSLEKMDDDRFEFFVKSLPNFTDPLMSHTLIFVSSYFDFVRLRNYFKKEQKSFVQMCEYTKPKKIARARDYFYHGTSHFLLYTERMHFFRRFRLKGIGHILFYQLPRYPHFYAELCELVKQSFQHRNVYLRKNCSVTSLYCKYDTSRLAAIVSTDRATNMLSSPNTVHAFVCGELV